MKTILSEIIAILNESSIYLLIGFLSAGVIHVVLARFPRLTAMFTGDGARPVVTSAVLGLPMPLCSCSVLPAAMTLRRGGASKGATASFLISVPETDIVSILLTFALLGGVMATFRPVSALFIALAAGMTINYIDARRRAHASPRRVANPSKDPHDAAVSGGCCHEEAHSAPEPQKVASGCCHDEQPSPQPEHQQTTHSCCHSDNESAQQPAAQSCCHDDQPADGSLMQVTAGPWWRRALRYGFVKIFDDIIAQLFLGMIVAGILMAWLPGIEIVAEAHGAVWTYALMLVIGVPVYVCAVASTPVAAGLIAGGVSPGATLVFLLAGPATNIASLFVLNRELGRRNLAIYLGAIAAGSVAAGVAFDAFFGGSVTAAEVLHRHHEHGVTPVNIMATFVFMALLLASFYRTRLPQRLIARLRFGSSTEARRDA